MKRFLRAGERYALSKRKPKYIKLRYISLLAVLTTMCLYAVKQVSAQGAEPAATAVADIKPLQIGDSIPEYLWHLPLKMANHPDGKDSVKLDEYRGKTILLDFLSTGCPGCIQALPKLDDFQTDFAGTFVVFPVTSQTREHVAGFIPRNKFVKDIGLSFITDDTILKQHFPHLYISHVVWIDGEGTVRAMTGSSHVTDRTIREFQNGFPLDWPVKTEMTTFFNEPLIALQPNANSLENNANRPLHYAMITGYTEGVGPYIPTRADSLKGIERISYRNQPILNLYLGAVGMRYKIKPNDVIYEGVDPSEFSPEMADLSHMTNVQWYQRHAICYERTVPLGTSQKLRLGYLQADLDNLLNLRGRLETRNGETVFVISKNKSN